MRSAALGLTLLAGVVLLSACDSTGPSSGPPASIQKRAIPGGLVVGGMVDSVAITVTDKDGRGVEGVEVSWSATAGSATPSRGATDGRGVAATRWTLGTVSGQQQLTATVGSLQAVFDTYVSPGPAAAVVLDIQDTTLTSLGDTLHIHADGRDSYDNHTSTSGLTWISTAPEVASVNAGTVVARAEGSALIVVVNGPLTDTARVVVDQVVTGLRLDPPAPALTTGDSVNMTATPADARGNAVDTTMATTWSSSDESVATVDAGGTVRGIGPGDAVITASAGSFTAEANARVRSGPKPEISAILPAVLGAGDTATITGTGFSSSLSAIAVTVGGIPATVQSATSTEIRAVMPAPGAFPCGPQTDMDVVVSVNDLAATLAHPVAGAERHALAVGESVVFHGGAAACNELTADGHYVATVFNASPSLSVFTGFELKGTADAPGAALRAAGAGARRFLSIEPAAVTLPDNPQARGHLRMLDANQRLLRTLGWPGTRIQTSADGAVSARATASATAPQPGDVRTFRIPNIDGDQLCSDYATVTARVAYSGTKGVVWEDTAAPLAGTMDTAWARLGQEFDQVMYPVLLQYFGDPLVYDSHLDGDGRFFMLFSKNVNDFTAGVEGFVFSGDFFTRIQCPASNATENVLRPRAHGPQQRL